MRQIAARIWVYALTVFLIALVAIIIRSGDNNRHQEYVEQITNIHTHRVAACLDFFKVYNEAQCEDYLFIQGRDREYYEEILMER